MFNDALATTHSLFAIEQNPLDFGNDVLTSSIGNAGITLATQHNSTVSR